MAKSELAVNELQAPVKQRRKRRSTQEVINCILDAAVVEFSESGYTSATTAAIARRAGVVEALIFSHFDSKKNLFHKAVYRSLDNHFSDFLKTHDSDDSDIEGLLKNTREYVSDLAHFVRMHSGLFKSLIVNEAYAYGKDEDLLVGPQGLQDYFNKMADTEVARLKRRPQVSPHLIARISFATILGCVLFEDWLFPIGIASEREIHEGLCDFLMDGVNVNTPMASL